MPGPPITPEHSSSEAVAIMVKHDISRLAVLENDVAIGMVTRSDARLYFYDLLPDSACRKRRR